MPNQQPDPTDARTLAVSARFALRDVRAQADHLRALLDAVEDNTAALDGVVVRDDHEAERLYRARIDAARESASATIRTLADLLRETATLALHAEAIVEDAAEQGYSAKSHHLAPHAEAAGRAVRRATKLCSDVLRLFDLCFGQRPLAGDDLSSVLDYAAQVATGIEDRAGRDEQNGQAEEDGAIYSREAGESEAARDDAVVAVGTLHPNRHRPATWPIFPR